MTRKLNARLDDAGVKRRIDFLLREAAQDEPVRDNAVVYAQRAISNFYSIGRDGSSNRIRRLSRFHSEEAHKLWLDFPYEKWRQMVICEHQEPLIWFWRWLCEHKGQLDHEAVIARVKRWPSVVVTKTEDRLLRNHQDVDARQRYADAKIVVLEQNAATMEWLPRVEIGS